MTCVRCDEPHSLCQCSRAQIKATTNVICDPVAAADRIEELEAERDDCARVNRDMCAENVRLKAKLDAVEKLPEKWRPLGIGYLGEYENALVKCANELEAALQEKEG